MVIRVFHVSKIQHNYGRVKSPKMTQTVDPLSKPVPRPPSSVPSGSTLRAHQTRDNPSEASYYQAAPSKEPPFQPPRASPSQKLPEAPWPNPQPSILASAPQKPQSQLINTTSSQPERSTAAIEEGLTHLGSIHGGSSHVNTTQGRAFSSTQLRAENGSSLPQATNGKSKVGGGCCSIVNSFLCQKAEYLYFLSILCPRIE